MVQSVSQKSKTIDKGKSFAERMKKKAKKMNYKKKDQKDMKQGDRIAGMMAAKKISNKQKRKLSKSLWETTQNIIV